MQWLDELAECSEHPVELTRRYLTPEHARAAELIMERMREAGMKAWLDAVGNVVGRFPGRRPEARRLILGSHLDTVRNAGKYDGALGVLLPIACLKALDERGERLEYPVDVIAFGDEEGSPVPGHPHRQPGRRRRLRSRAPRRRGRGRGAAPRGVARLRARPGDGGRGRVPS